MKSASGVLCVLLVGAVHSVAAAAAAPGKGNWLGSLLGGKPTDEKNGGPNNNKQDENIQLQLQTGRKPLPPPPPSGAMRRYPYPPPQAGVRPSPPFPPPPPPGPWAGSGEAERHHVLLEGDKDENKQKENDAVTGDVSSESTQQPPPPPYIPYGAGGGGGYWFGGPPPPISFPPAPTDTVDGGADGNSEKGGEDQDKDGDGEGEQDDVDEQQQQQHRTRPPPPPGGQYWGNPQQQQQQYLPPPGYAQWHAMDPQQQQMAMAGQQQQQQQQMQAQYEDWEAGVEDTSSTDPIQYLQSELEAASTREADLIYQITNLTSSLSSAEETAVGRLHTIDVLTERISESEARAASEGNAVRELSANCTELADTVAKLQEEATEWEGKCATLEEQSACDAKEMQEVRDEIRRKQAELEDLACAIEEDRVDAERERYLEEIRKKRKKRGFFGIILSGIFGKGYDEEEERLKAQELARSTLIHALQIERSNVDELEASLLILQQNNSAIADMVESRDYVINELNDRVEVFEEDKIVLKAALRQLQKEMKEEGPRTQRVAADLKKAQEEIKHLHGEAKRLKAKHSDKVSALAAQIQERDKQINETESKMSMIATYVDQLEERLASFAIARRDIGVREEKCKKLEERDEHQKEAMASLQIQIDSLLKEKVEMTSLIDLMVEERAVLQRNKASLEGKARTLEEESKTLKLRLLEKGNEIARLESKLERAEQTMEELESAVASAGEKLTAAEALAEQERIEAERKIEAAGKLDSQKQEEFDELTTPSAEAEADAFSDAHASEASEGAVPDEVAETNDVVDFIPPPPPPPPPPPVDDDVFYDATPPSLAHDYSHAEGEFVGGDRHAYVDAQSSPPDYNEVAERAAQGNQGPFNEFPLPPPPPPRHEDSTDTIETTVFDHEKYYVAHTQTPPTSYDDVADGAPIIEGTDAVTDIDHDECYDDARPHSLEPQFNEHSEPTDPGLEAFYDAHSTTHSTYDESTDELPIGVALLSKQASPDVYYDAEETANDDYVFPVTEGSIEEKQRGGVENAAEETAQEDIGVAETLHPTDNETTPPELIDKEEISIEVPEDEIAFESPIVIENSSDEENEENVVDAQDASVSAIAEFGSEDAPPEDEETKETNSLVVEETRTTEGESLSTEEMIPTVSLPPGIEATGGDTSPSEVTVELAGHEEDEKKIPPSDAPKTPPSLPGPRDPRGNLPPVPPRKLIKPTRHVPFRMIRKAFSKATGVHGLFTPPSRPRRSPPPRPSFVTPKIANGTQKNKAT